MLLVHFLLHFLDAIVAYVCFEPGVVVVVAEVFALVGVMALNAEVLMHWLLKGVRDFNFSKNYFFHQSYP